MTIIPEVTSVTAKPVSPLLYPVLLIAGIGVIVASLLGMALITGLLPHAKPQEQTVIGRSTAGNGNTVPDTDAALQSGRHAVATGGSGCPDATDQSCARLRTKPEKR